MPAAYMIVESNISDPEKFKDYMASAPAVVKEFAGDYLVRGGRHQVLEGHWQPQRIAMLRFPSLEKAQAFYDAEMYRAARALRAGATEYFNMVVVEGVDAPV